MIPSEEDFDEDDFDYEDFDDEMKLSFEEEKEARKRADELEDWFELDKYSRQYEGLGWEDEYD